LDKILGDIDVQVPKIRDKSKQSYVKKIQFDTIFIGIPVYERRRLDELWGKD